MTDHPRSYQFTIKLLSDTTFGRGDGVAGLLDQEVEHDAAGLPYLRGRTLKGLVSETCENLIEQFSTAEKSRWQAIANRLFGTLGSTAGTIAAAHFGDACLPTVLHDAIAYQISQKSLTATEALGALTTIRRQTAIDPNTGAPDKGSLRAARVICRNHTFTADVQFEQAPTDDMRSLLAMGAVGLRRIGSGRNRGRGHVRCSLHSAPEGDITLQCLAPFNPAAQEAPNA